MKEIEQTSSTKGNACEGAVSAPAMQYENVDAPECRPRETARRDDIYSDIAHALTRRYDDVYHIDLEQKRCARLVPEGDGADAMEPEAFFEMVRGLPLHRDDRGTLRALENPEALAEAVEREGSLVYTVRLKRDHRYVYTRFRCMRAGDSRRVVVAVYDVDKKVRSLQAREHDLKRAELRATMDDLTRVRNKNAYVDLEEELQRNIDDGTVEPLAIAVCDVNNLKDTNDDFGHKAGDALLQAACKLICVNYAHSPVFRVGGDEFAVVMRGEDYQNRRQLLQKMREMALENLRNGGAVVAVGMSEYDGDDFITDVFERADREMYANKRALKSLYTVWS